MTVARSHSPMPPTYPFLNTTRLGYLTLCTVAGIGATLMHPSSGWPDSILWGTIGLAVGYVALWLEAQLRTYSLPTLIGGSVGLIVGIAGAGLVFPIIGITFPELSSHWPWIMLPLFLLCPYIGMATGIHIFQTVSSLPFSETTKNASLPIQSPRPTSVEKLLDSSAIIDGRVIHLCTTGFLEGPLLIPQCILQELHTLADSAYPSKRTKGKRGLEILSQLQQIPDLDLKIIDDSEPGELTVDHKLIAIAKKRHAKIVTNDWNLAKIADLQDVQSLNVNELTYQLRPLVLPGEIIRVFIQKEGQGFEQGIAHLDDGTMVVIDHGADLVGQAIDVEVTRFMQTNTGRMIFAIPEPQETILTRNQVSLPQHIPAHVSI